MEFESDAGTEETNFRFILAWPAIYKQYKIYKELILFSPVDKFVALNIF